MSTSLYTLTMSRISSLDISSDSIFCRRQVSTSVSQTVSLTYNGSVRVRHRFTCPCSEDQTHVVWISSSTASDAEPRSDTRCQWRWSATYRWTSWRRCTYTTRQQHVHPVASARFFRLTWAPCHFGHIQTSGCGPDPQQTGLLQLSSCQSIMGNTRSTTATASPVRRTATCPSLSTRDHVCPALMELHWSPVCCYIQFKLALVVNMTLTSQSLYIYMHLIRLDAHQSAFVSSSNSLLTSPT